MNPIAFRKLGNKHLIDVHSCVNLTRLSWREAETNANITLLPSLGLQCCAQPGEQKKARYTK